MPAAQRPRELAELRGRLESPSSSLTGQLTGAGAAAAPAEAPAAACRGGVRGRADGCPGRGPSRCGVRDGDDGEAGTAPESPDKRLATPEPTTATPCAKVSSKEALGPCRPFAGPALCDSPRRSSDAVPDAVPESAADIMREARSSPSSELASQKSLSRSSSPSPAASLCAEMPEAERVLSWETPLSPSSSASEKPFCLHSGSPPGLRRRPCRTPAAAAPFT